MRARQKKRKWICQPGDHFVSEIWNCRCNLFLMASTLLVWNVDSRNSERNNVTTFPLRVPRRHPHFATLWSTFFPSLSLLLMLLLLLPLLLLLLLLFCFLPPLLLFLLFDFFSPCFVSFSHSLSFCLYFSLSLGYVLLLDAFRYPSNYLTTFGNEIKNTAVSFKSNLTISNYYRCPHFSRLLLLHCLFLYLYYGDNK